MVEKIIHGIPILTASYTKIQKPSCPQLLRNNRPQLQHAVLVQLVQPGARLQLVLLQVCVSRRRVPAHVHSSFVSVDAHSVEKPVSPPLVLVDLQPVGAHRAIIKFTG